MAGKEFWVPNELALEILGFNKNILEKRISADYIKRETRGGIELLEISGEIERFGLSEDLAREKLDEYINKNSSTLFDKKKSEPEKPKLKSYGNETTVSQVGIPVTPISQPVAQPIAPSVITTQPNAIDYTPQLNKMAQVLDDIRKLTISMPELIVKIPKEPNLPNPQITDLKSDFLKLSVLAEQNLTNQKEVLALQGQLKSSNAEVAKLTTQCNSVMDELERTNQKHNKEIESLKSTIKSEISGMSSILSLKLRKPKAGIFVVILLLIICGGVGFIISELIQPSHSVLVQPNDKINPITKKDVETTVIGVINPLEEKLKKTVETLNIQNKDTHQKELTDITNTVSLALEAQKESLKKYLDGVSQTQKDSKVNLDENYTKSLKAIETQVVDLEKLIKKMLETTVQIKPGTKFIPDSNE